MSVFERLGLFAFLKYRIKNAHQWEIHENVELPNTHIEICA